MTPQAIIDRLLRLVEALDASVRVLVQTITEPQAPPFAERYVLRLPTLEPHPEVWLTPKVGTPRGWSYEPEHQIFRLEYG